VLRYTREEAEAPTSNGSSSSSNSFSAEPLTAAMPALQWQQLSGDMQQQLLQQSGGAAAVAVGISGTRFTLQQHQQRMLQELPSDDDVDDARDVTESSRSSSSSSRSSGALVLSVSQLWEFGHEMGHALHLMLSSR
jgi:hypothetical protein